MRKLTLDLHALAVDSFPIPAADGARGTVAAHAPTQTTCPVTGGDCQTNIIFCPSRVVSQCGCVSDTC
ncbi:hypothetical protein [Longimicrobium sp.]|uniref:hypothetical protein n=1 Tax=Longimicrobium sp. TaxID=2029185 RepID=UPI002BFF88A6|nr:hypothetical protein [Longimicrobium sp.]HSU12565.1 hypothetical protein [Longimicrobium sp.]